VARLFEAFRVGDTDAFDDLIVDDYVQHVAQAANGLQAAKDYCAPVGAGRRRGASDDHRG
jgi:predicted SnoaL-like aldol condensation-catalyzing enzyme